MENEAVSQGVQNVAPVAPVAPVADAASAPVADAAPVAPVTEPKESPVESDADKQIALLRKELRASQIKAAMADQHLAPLDKDLVSRLIEEKLTADGSDVDTAVAALFKSHPYLFSAPQIQKATADKAKADAAKAAEQSFNKRLIEGAIARIRRAPIKL